jgi:hypothetical protein
MNTKAKVTMPRTRDFSPQLTGHDYPQPLINGVIKTICPPLLAQVDMNQFIRSVLASYSLSLTEKFRVLAALPTLSQFRCDALLDVWSDEAEEFQALTRSAWPTVMRLCAEAWINANMLANYLGAGYGEVEERHALQTMLAAKYDTPAKKSWIQSGLTNNHPLSRHVFGSAVQYPYAHITATRSCEKLAPLGAAFVAATVVLPNEF